MLIVSITYVNIKTLFLVGKALTISVKNHLNKSQKNSNSTVGVDLFNKN